MILDIKLRHEGTGSILPLTLTFPEASMLYQIELGPDNTDGYLRGSFALNLLPEEVEKIGNGHWRYRRHSGEDFYNVPAVTWNPDRLRRE